MKDSFPLNNPSIGNRIINSLGKYESGVLLYPIDARETRRALVETVNLLKAKQKELKLSGKLKNSCLIQSLFITPNEPNCNFKSMYKRANIQVLIEFLDWILNIKTLNDKLHEIRDLLQTFVYDLGTTRVLDESFFSHDCGRSKTNHTFFHFYDCKKLLFLNQNPSIKTREFLSIFGLRQSMETKFRRVIGYSGINPQIKMQHNTIPDIISFFENDISFHKDKNISLKDILHIYKWTNYSIHNMMSIYPWLIWKAFDACEIIFDFNNDGPTTLRGLDSSFQFSTTILNKMRGKLREEIQKIADKDKVEYTIFWINPEAYVFDEKNKTLNLADCGLNKSDTVFPKKAE